MDENITHHKGSLIKKITIGDKKAFSQFFDLEHQRIFGFAYHILKDKEQAADIVQQVFIKIWEHRDKLIEVNNCSAYLYTISKNLIFNALKKKVADFAIQKYYKETTDQLFLTTELDIHYNETQKIIDDVVENLPAKRRQIFKLSRYSGFSNQEIAMRLNTSTSFIENQINKSLKTIRAHLKYNEIIPTLLVVLLPQVVG